MLLEQPPIYHEVSTHCQGQNLYVIKPLKLCWYAVSSTQRKTLNIVINLNFIDIFNKR